MQTSSSTAPAAQINIKERLNQIQQQLSNGGQTPAMFPQESIVDPSQFGQMSQPPSKSSTIISMIKKHWKIIFAVIAIVVVAVLYKSYAKKKKKAAADAAAAAAGPTLPGGAGFPPRRATCPIPGVGAAPPLTRDEKNKDPNFTAFQ
jgi:hypothetical protein